MDAENVGTLLQNKTNLRRSTKKKQVQRGIIIIIFRMNSILNTRYSHPVY
jgi:hypothetical protein